MITVEVPTRLTIDDLMAAVNQLPNRELISLVRHVVEIQVQRGLSTLPNEDEQSLIKTIGEKQLEKHEKRRLNLLRQKNREGTITASEYAELLQFVKRVEQQDLARLDALVELARRRNMSVAEVSREFGIDAEYA